MQYLKQSTAVTKKLGPFLDEDDGKTPEEGLAIAQADIRLSKNGGAFAQTNNAAGATHDENGWYGVPLDTTDTATLGSLKVAIHESGAGPVWETFLVVTANVYDSMCSTDKLQVDAVEISSDSTAADDLELLVENCKGADHKVLISTDAQDLNATLAVNAKAISGSTTAADNAEIVFDTDFATNYDTTNDKWQTESDLLSIGGELISGYNATLKLKQMDIQNSAGSALITKATGGNGHGFYAVGYGTGSGIEGEGTATTPGIHGMGAPGIYGEGVANNAPGIWGVGHGTGAGIHGDITGNITGNLSGTIGSLGAQAKLDVNVEADTALTDYDPPTRTEATSDALSIVTAIGNLNNVSESEVNAQCDAAVADIKTVTDKLGTMVEAVP